MPGTRAKAKPTSSASPLATKSTDVSAAMLPNGKIASVIVGFDPPLRLATRVNDIALRRYRESVKLILMSPPISVAVFNFENLSNGIPRKRKSCEVNPAFLGTHRATKRITSGLPLSESDPDRF
jgi:hypothetical protein